MRASSIRKGRAIDESKLILMAEELAKNRFESKLIIEPLSPRENTVLQMLSKGLSPDDVRQLLGTSMSTVRTHTRNIYTKLDVCSSVQAISMAQRHGLINIPNT